MATTTTASGWTRQARVARPSRHAGCWAGGGRAGAAADPRRQDRTDQQLHVPAAEPDDRLRHRRARPQSADRLQRADLAGPRRLLRRRRLRRRRPDGPVRIGPTGRRCRSRRIVCFIVGYLFGLPALRLEGHYLALATFALAIAVPQILKYRHFEDFTHGVQGINIFKPRAAVRPAAQRRPVDVSGGAGRRGPHVLARPQSARQPHRARADGDPRPSHGRQHDGHQRRPVQGRRRSASARSIPASPAPCTPSSSSSSRPTASASSCRSRILVGAVVGGIASLPGAVIGGVFVQVIEKYADALTKKIAAAVHLPIDLEPWTIYGIALIVLDVHHADGHRRRPGAAVAAASGIVTARSDRRDALRLLELQPRRKSDDDTDDTQTDACQRSRAARSPWRHRQARRRRSTTKAPPTPRSRSATPTPIRAMLRPTA